MIALKLSKGAKSCYWMHPAYTIITKKKPKYTNTHTPSHTKTFSHSFKYTNLELLNLTKKKILTKRGERATIKEEEEEE